MGNSEKMKLFKIVGFCPKGVKLLRQNNEIPYFVSLKPKVNEIHFEVFF